MLSCAVCDSCDGVNLRRCNGCFQVAYCSKDHQRRHWPQHRRECRPFREVHLERKGRWGVTCLKIGYE